MARVQRAQAEVPFRAGAHAVRMAASGDALELEVEDPLTADQWRGEFDAAFIEDLTHKTGNFKQFGIFCSMLESALTQSSEAVSLDLLTYADLEALRSRKLGGRPAARAAPAPALGSKRYLILIYSVEFDRIHYPLPLPYAGRPDPAALQRVIRELREELALLKGAAGREPRDAETRRLRDELRRAQEEKRQAEAAALALREELRQAGGARDARALQRALRGLEAELRSERGQRQRERRQLAAELAEAKAAERTLRLRVKSLSAELAGYKKGGGGAGERAGSWPRQRSASRESGGRRERGPRRSPSPSPAGERRPPRFDPTAFVRARQRRQQEAELRNERRRRPGATWSRGAESPARGRSSSVESARSRRSAASSASEADDYAEPSRGRRRAPRARKPLGSAAWNGPGSAPRAPGARKTPASSAAGSGKENLRAEPPAELAEIDARLQALQEYMSSLDTRT